MPLIQWDDSFSVKIAEIDRQHFKLVEMINQAMRQGEGRAILGNTINALISYVNTHFATEEKYFKRFAYPETQAHVREHQKFVEQVATLRDSFVKGTAGLSVKTMNFLRSWLLQHIKGSDQKYTQHFLAQGLA